MPLHPPPPQQQTSWLPILLSIVVSYASLLRYLRWRHGRHLDDQPPLEHPAKHDDDHDDTVRRAHAIHVDTIHRDQPYLSRKGVELGLLKTFAVPSISRLLAATGQFRRHTERRSEDVDLLVSEFLEHCPLDSARARLAVRRMNAIHARYKGKISNEDYVYVLCVFACQAIMWIDRYGWRRVHPIERTAVSPSRADAFRVGFIFVADIYMHMHIPLINMDSLHPTQFQSYVYWRYIGELMGIQNIPTSYDRMEEYLHSFENGKMVYAKCNVEVFQPTIAFNLSRCPRLLRPLFRMLLAAICHEKMREALDLAAPPRYAIVLLHAILFARGFVDEYVLPPRRRRLQRTPVDGNRSDARRVRPSYHPATACPYRSSGYRIGMLGPPGLLKDDDFGKYLPT